MKPSLRKVLRILLYAAVSIVVLLAGLVAYAFWSYSQPPVVHLTNNTGGLMRQVTIHIGDAEASAGDLENGRTVTRKVPFKGSEGAARVTWVDASGQSHEGMDNDYLEGKGGYHTYAVVTPDNQVRAIHPASKR
jgi:hypothetical protein